MQVSVRILGGLMALGYEIGTIMKRTSVIHANDKLTVKLDAIEGLGKGFIQVRLPYIPASTTLAVTWQMPTAFFECSKQQNGQNCTLMRSIAVLNRTTCVIPVQGAIGTENMRQRTSPSEGPLMMSCVLIDAD